MAKVGLKYPVAALLNENGGVVSHTGGKEIGRAIKADISIEVYDEKLYADDGIAEMEKGFKSGKISLNIDDLSDDIQVMLLGHAQVDANITAESDVKELIASGNDEAPYVGIGFCGKKKVRNVVKYRAIWLTKVKFGEPQDSTETRGDNINFQTPTIEGDIALDASGQWKHEATFSSERAAKEWLNKKAAILS